MILLYHLTHPLSSDTMSTSPAKMVIGFNVLAKKNWVLHRNIHPPDQSTLTGDASIGWKVKSLFTKGAGKCKVDPLALAPMSEKRHLASVSITPDAARSSNAATTTPFSTPRPRTNMMRATPQYSLVDPAPLPMYGQAIVPPHAYNWASVLQPIYKCLPPDDVGRLKAGDELIVVVPAVGPKTPNDVVCILRLYT